MKIALIQQSASDNKSQNIERGLIAVKDAAKIGANIICFAELAFTKFYPQYPSDDNNLRLAETIPGPTTDNTTYDSSPVIDSEGNILGTTRMIHITDYTCFHEKGYYTPGNNGAQVYDTRFGKIGVAICYDRHYPEYMRALALKGAEIVFIPQAGITGEWPEGLYESELRVAAFQNGYFTALCNRVGKEDKLTFAGESFVCDPEGNVICRADKEIEENLYSDVDLDQVNRSFAKQSFLGDRRPELYGDWLSK
jgi:N-carbamoylputrescine amidase